MPEVARIYDLISHGGYILMGSANVTTNNRQTARKFDLVYCFEHGTVAIAEGSSNCTCNNLPVARVGDKTTCGATIIQGSWNASCGG